MLPVDVDAFESGSSEVLQLLVERDHVSNVVLEAGLQRLGLKVTALVELGSTTVIKSAVQSGVGPAVLSRLAATNEVKEGKLMVVLIDGLALDRQIRAVWPKAVPLLPAARALTTLVASNAGSRVFPQ